MDAKHRLKKIRLPPVGSHRPTVQRPNRRRGGRNPLKPHLSRRAARPKAQNPLEGFIHPDQRRIFRPPTLPAGVYQRTERQAARRAVQPKPRRRGKGDAMNYFGMVEFLRLMAMVRPPFVFFSGTRSELPTYLDLVAELRLTGWERFAGSQTLTVSSTSTAIQATTTT